MRPGQRSANLGTRVGGGALGVLALAGAAAAGAPASHTGPWRGAAPTVNAQLLQAACPPQMVLAGLTGSGRQVPGVIDGALCVQLMADGKWHDRTPRRFPVTSAPAGSGGFRLQCAPDQVVKGVSGRAGSTVESLALLCGAPAQDAEGRLTLAGAGAATSPVGTGTGPAFDESCPPGLLAVQVEGARAPQDSSLQAVRLGCDPPPAPVRYGVESLTLSKDTLRPGESATLTITLKGPAGPGHSMVIHTPAYVTPAEFKALPGWTVTVPPRQRTVTATIEASANASPAFGGPYVDLRPDYDPLAPTKRLTVVPAR